MCGIIGCVNGGDVVPTVLSGLANLEYRGYDSAGIAVANGGITVTKRAGDLNALTEALEGNQPAGPVGLGHTRWSTHGPPTAANAHPHRDCSGSVAVVHNGIIENYQPIKDDLEADGHEFESETDTEVIPHLIEQERRAGADPGDAFRAAVEAIDGSYAVAAIFESERAIYGSRADSPLIVGVGDDRLFLASDVPAFLEYTDRVVYVEDGQFVRLTPAGWTITDASGTALDPTINRVDWDPEATGKGGYAHYMLKEINEQPRALRDCIRGRVDELAGRVTLEGIADLSPPGRIHFVGCGTSYHAAAYGAHRFRELGIPAGAFIASEYASAVPPIGDDLLVVGITQSGETADTLQALREVGARSGTIPRLAVTNVVGSSATRECDATVYIRSGPEIGVAATKTFASQLVVLNLIAESIRETQGQASGTAMDRITALRRLPDHVQEILDRADRARSVADRYSDAEAYFFIGRGFNATVALEGALKMKEITYKHAEGFPAGELKHGPLALVTEDTPIFATVTGSGAAARKTVNNIKEVEARGAPVVAVTDGRTDAERYADDVLPIPKTDSRIAPILANVHLQLVAYFTARNLGRSIDRPRHLAKSVTVE